MKWFPDLPEFLKSKPGQTSGPCHHFDVRLSSEKQGNRECTKHCPERTRKPRMNGEKKMNDDRCKELESALKVIYTWACMDIEHTEYEKSLNPVHVKNLCSRALKMEIKK